MFHWPPQGVSTGGGGVAPQVDKFKQVSSDDYQMSVTEEGFAGAQVPSLERGRAGGPLGCMSREEGYPTM